MLDGPHDVPMVANAYGVRYPAHTDDHPAYTIDAKFACNATTYGGDHTCSCVYRKTVCDGSEHLCMCGSSWTDKRACYCLELHHHEKEKEMATPVGISMKAHMGEFEVEVSIKANSAMAPPSVLAEHQRRASKAMEVLLTDPANRGRDYEDEGPGF